MDELKEFYEHEKDHVLKQIQYYYKDTNKIEHFGPFIGDIGYSDISLALRRQVDPIVKDNQYYSLAWMMNNPYQIRLRVWSESYHNGDTYGEEEHDFDLDFESMVKIFAAINQKALHVAEREMLDEEEAQKQKALELKVRRFLQEKLEQY